MISKKNSKFKVVGEPLSDESLEKVSGGTFGQTAHTIYLTSQNYDMWVGSSMDQVVLFGATWAGPCHSVNDTLELLAAENPDYQVAIVDVDENQEYWANYISNIPTVIKFHNGYEIQRIIGNQSFDSFRRLFFNKPF